MSKYIIVSQLDADGVFVGVTQASESPLEPGVYLYPRGTVAAAPPDIPDGFFAKWENEWVLYPIPAPPEVEPPPEVVVVPTLTPAQFWMQLALDEDESEALAIIDTLPRPQQILALRARDYKRDNALLIQLATAMGKSSADIDAFFTEASAL